MISCIYSEKNQHQTEYLSTIFIHLKEIVILVKTNESWLSNREKYNYTNTKLINK